MTRTQGYTLIAVVVGLAAAVAVAYGPSASDFAFWKAASSIFVFALFVLVLLRRTPKVAEDERQTDDDFRDVPMPPTSFDWLHQLAGAVLATGRTIARISLAVGIPLGVLYFLVRFVKWAWSD